MLPFGSDYGYHVYHHSGNVGNYSSFFTFWDTVFGSNKTYYEFLEEIKETEAGLTDKSSKNKAEKGAKVKSE